MTDRTDVHEPESDHIPDAGKKVQPESEAGALADELEDAFPGGASIGACFSADMFKRILSALRNQPAAGAEPVAWMWEQACGLDLGGNPIDWRKIAGIERPTEFVGFRNIIPLGPISTTAAADMREVCAQVCADLADEFSQAPIFERAIRTLPLEGNA